MEAHEVLMSSIPGLSLEMTEKGGLSLQGCGTGRENELPCLI